MFATCPANAPLTLHGQIKLFFWSAGDGKYKVEYLSRLKPYCDASRGDWQEVWQEWNERKRLTIFLCEGHAKEYGFEW